MKEPKQTDEPYFIEEQDMTYQAMTALLAVIGRWLLRCIHFLHQTHQLTT